MSLGKVLFAIPVTLRPCWSVEGARNSGSQTRMSACLSDPHHRILTCKTSRYVKEFPAYVCCFFSVVCVCVCGTFSPFRVLGECPRDNYPILQWELLLAISLSHPTGGNGRLQQHL